MDSRSGYARRRPRVPAPALLVVALGVAAAATPPALRHAWRQLGPSATLPASPAAGSTDHVFLYLGQTRDCVGYGRTLRALGHLAVAEEIRLLVVLTDPPPPGELRDRLLTGLGQGATLRDDLSTTALRVARRLGQDRTPVGILLDGRGRPLLVLPPERLGAPAPRLLASVRAALATTPPAAVRIPRRTPRTS